ncbi:NAD(P)H-quinone oxidoreductase [Ramlibacter sp. AW1]|uniref:NAD(P)H-quinone oxidoreductase n=2 Tax=Ramlibacter aurantiacus TaxID=2801330 RepID=A0A936ZGN1_9BURK|nr:NAD(P)H-quinone oxidoreductase [Ramlibacter aurantiacus]MBL0421089.1 NAD(P)H-quinone oxidoreductase [Ramlibacter aurantiacus]
MRCVQIERPGGPEVLSIGEAPRPEAGPGEVLIRVEAAGMNHADLAQRAGKYPPPPDASPLLGLEAAGTVAAVGPGVQSLREGDRVCTLTHGGAYAEYVRAPAAHCLPFPAGCRAAEAAAVPEVAMTVWSNVWGHGRLAPGERLLVHGGASGIGSFAIQLAVARGHEVLATVGSPGKVAAVSRWGAKPIAYREEPFEDRVAALTDGRGVDVILDMVGGDYTPRNVRCLAMDGRLVQIAFLQGGSTTLNWMDVLRRRAVLTGSLLRPRSTQDKARIVAELQREVWPLYAAGTLPRPVVDRVFPFEQVRQAHEFMDSGAHIGKIVLEWCAA